MKSYYFDHAATTPMHPEVAKVMLAIMQGAGGNPSSMHAFGREAKLQVSRARDTIAAALGCKPTELVFTSGGTESDNAAIIGAAMAMRKNGKNHIITSTAEHHAVLHTCEFLSREGFSVTYLPVDGTGKVSPEDVAAAITPETGLITIMHGNNEVGTLNPIEAIGAVAKAQGVLFHVDAVQSFGLLDYRLQQIPVDFMSFSAHKINGPQGIGALYIANGTPFEPIAHGGSQERKRRAGTENVAGIAGFAKAVDICVNNRAEKQLLMDKLRKEWIGRLKAAMPDVEIIVNGDEADGLPHIVNLSFIGIDTETMLMSLDLAGIAASSGSACTSGALERSHVLRAMDLPEERLNSAVRFSFGLGNTVEELEDAAKIVETISARIRTNV
ncbi:cysteine desulfurase family protein [Paenibacillus radicis (ex Gao et al. 2016)]|uniref:cysteine desulfurase n=1 Tax=Paenibacillus radicis (ex Gao et al. 2016) TaxID=1737354 RepID=A0A917HLV1_9BACL|nr:cysteine desulfurase family protein [Paenibacillus radicis (ex Gao et al. 2016)]GGG83862.1 cysteine desulfurase [Paenibacillus radicis (ex Gao et al. 2016)]